MGRNCPNLINEIMIEYKYKKKENKFTENGHTMFEFDVLQRLKRLADLEEQIKQGQLLPIQRVSNLLFDFCTYLEETTNIEPFIYKDRIVNNFKGKL